MKKAQQLLMSNLNSRRKVFRSSKSKILGAAKRSVLLLAVIFLSLATFGQKGLDDSLVAYYPFNGNANDESGNNYNATSVENVSWQGSNIVVNDSSLIEFSSDIIVGDEATYYLDFNIESITQEYYYGINFWVNGGTLPVFDDEAGTLIYTDTWWDDHGLDLDINQDGNDYHLPDTYMSSNHDIDADRFWNIPFETGFTLHDFSMWTNYFKWGSFSNCGGYCSYNPTGVRTIWSSPNYYDFDYSDYGTYKGFLYGYYFPTFQAAPILDIKGNLAVMADNDSIHLYFGNYSQHLASFPYSTGQCKLIIKVANSNELTVYLNGSLIDTYTTPWNFGSGHWSSTVVLGGGFEGSADEFRVYNRALSQEEVMELAGATAATGEITNVNATQRTDGTKILDVSYDLSGSEAEYLLSLEVSFEAGENYQTVNGVSGDVGMVAPGTNLLASWDAGTEFPEGFFNQSMKVRLKAEAQGGTFTCGDDFTDARDGQTYSTVLIGDQCWMAENLNIGIRIDGSSDQIDNGTVEKYCYDNNEANCDIYGGMYQWNEMMDYVTTEGVQGICPAGWYLPTDAEWTVLTTYLGGESVAGGKMKETGTSHWNSPNTGATNSSGFTGLPGGYRYTNGAFDDLGYDGDFWSSTEYSTTSAWGRVLTYSDDNAYSYYYTKGYGLSVRCVREGASANLPPEAPTSPNPENEAIGQLIESTLSWSCSDPENDPLTYDVFFGTESTPAQVATAQSETTFDPGILEYNTQYFWKIVAHDDQGNSTEGEVWSFTTEAQSGTFTCGEDFTDARDGQTYSTVQIGDQCWMAENLAYLPEVSPSSQGNNSDPYYYVYDYQGSDVAEAKATTNYQTYGVLYNWPASLNACPEGWYLPTDAEWTTLTDYVSSQPEYICNGNTDYIAKALAATTNWISSSNTCAVGNNLSANNATGFSGLPGGFRHPDGKYHRIGASGVWWSSTENSTTNAWLRDLYLHTAQLSRSDGSKGVGLSARCFRDIEQPNLPPTLPSNPNPENEAIGQLIESTLSWTCTDPDGDPLTYDVFFGTEVTPAQVATGQSETTFDPGTLEYNTPYFWQIVAHDNQGNTTQGEVWSFTTEEENLPPAIPSNPTPINEDIDQAVETNLSWTCTDLENDPLTYDVFFGTEATPAQVATGQSETTYNPGTLEYNTQYFWQIVAHDDQGNSTEGEVWSFTTEEENFPPAMPSNPAPINEDIDQPVEADLSWECTDPDGDPLSYDVFFGTEASPALVATGQSETTFDPGTLEYNTQYFWQIIADDNQGNTTEGEVWSFNTIQEVFEVCTSDTVTLDFEDYESGLVQWQESIDGFNWMNMPGAFSTELNVVPEETKYYRAKATFGDLPPQYSKISLVQLIPIADAGIGRTLPYTFVDLYANESGTATGTWTVASGEGGSFTNVNDPYTTFEGDFDTYELVWTLTNNCGFSSDTIVVEFIENEYIDNIVYVDSTDILLSDSTEIAQGLINVTFSEPVPEINDSSIIIGVVNTSFIQQVDSFNVEAGVHTIYASYATLEQITENGSYDIADAVSFITDPGGKKASGFVELDHMPTRSQLNDKSKFKGNEVYYYIMESPKEYMSPGVKLNKAKGGLLSFEFESAQIGPDELNAKISGYYDFIPNFVSEIKFKNLRMNECTFGMVNSKQIRGLDINLFAGAAFELVKKEAHFWGKSKKIVFVVGGVPVVITVDFTLNGEWKAEASSGIEINFKFLETTTKTAAYVYKNGHEEYLNPEPKIQREFKKSIGINECTIEQKLKIVPRVDFKLYDIAGPYIEAAPTAKLTTSFSGINQSWKANFDFGVDIKLGAKLKVFKKEIFNVYNTWPIHIFDLELPHQLDIVSGNNQTYSSAFPTVGPISIKVLSDWGFGVPGTKVHFEPQNGGTVVPEVATTNMNGIAQVSWTPGGEEKSYLNVSAYGSGADDPLSNSPLTVAAHNVTSPECAESGLLAFIDYINNYTVIRPQGYSGTGLYQYSLNGWEFQSLAHEIVPEPGVTYKFWVKDSQGCVVATEPFTKPLDPCLGNGLAVSTRIIGTTINALPSGGDLPYTFSLDDEAGPWTNTNEFHDISVGDHVLYVMDANGCISSSDFEIPIEALEVQAVFSTATYGVPVGQEFKFENWSSNADTYVWNFGDGTTSNEVEPMHTYNQEGSYTVTLEATNSATGKSDLLEMEDYMTALNVPPDQGFVASVTQGTAPLTVQFVEDIPLQGQFITREWDFGDGYQDDDENPFHTYLEAGVYTVTLTVRSLNGDLPPYTKEDLIWVSDELSAPYNPTPTDGATDQAIETQLTWEYNNPPESTVTYDVYFGTEEIPPLVATGITEATYDPGTLDYNTQYNWQILANDDQGTTALGAKWTFTTEEEPAGSACGEDFTDARDGQTYSTVQIGGQCWMVENLNIGERIDGSEDMTDNGTIEKYCYNDDETNCDTYGGLYQWNEMMEYVTNEGIQGICPLGWRIPADAEWIALTDHVSSQTEYLCNDNTSYIAKAFAANTNWNTNPGTCAVGNNLAANNTIGYTALPGGTRNNYGLFINIGDHGHWWSSTEYDETHGYGNYLLYSSSQVGHGDRRKSFGVSVRCVRDAEQTNLPPTSPSNPTPENETTEQPIETNLSWTCSDPENDPLTYDVFFGTEATPAQVATGQSETTFDPGTLEYNTQYFWQIVAHDNMGNTTEGEVWSFTTEAQGGTFTCGEDFTDARDGQTYSTVLIGDQCWMAENLAYLPEVSPSSQGNNTNPYYYVYDYQGTDVAEAKASTNYQTYGVLYNWPASLDACPEGWHLPTDAEWCTLEQEVDPTITCSSTSLRGVDGGGKLKESGNTHWNSPNTGATNSSGFTALPGGNRSSLKPFYNLGTNGFWWSSSQGGSNAWHRVLTYNCAQVIRINYDNMSLGLSVRCLKDN